jgi:uracil phosphoribosyltransferase
VSQVSSLRIRAHDWLVSRIKLLCVLGTRIGLEKVQSEYPELEARSWFSLSAQWAVIEKSTRQIWIAGIDPVLTADGIISPGLGDAVSVDVSFSYHV